MAERQRQELAGRLEPETLTKRKSEGWLPVAIEWERVEAEPGRAGSVADAGSEVELYPIPYGLTVAADGRHLQDEPGEREIIEVILALISEDKALSEIAEILNDRGFRSRAGAAWDQVRIFKLLPRLVEAAPHVFRSGRWTELKLSLIS